MKFRRVCCFQWGYRPGRRKSFDFQLDTALGQFPFQHACFLAASDHTNVGCQRCSVSVVQPAVDSIDMKASAMARLDWLGHNHRPREADLCFVAPADVQTIQNGLIDELIETYASAHQKLGKRH